MYSSGTHTFGISPDMGVAIFYVIDKLCGFDIMANLFCNSLF